MDLFYGKNDVFSNFYVAKFTTLLPFPFGWQIMHCSEQLYQFYKAYFSNSMEKCQYILNTKSAAECKRIGKSTKIPIQWKLRKINIMRECLLKKFLMSHNSHYLYYKLMNAAPIIAECNPYDLFLGIGLNKNNARKRPMEDWPGLNMMGILLMELQAFLWLLHNNHPDIIHNKYYHMYLIL